MIANKCIGVGCFFFLGVVGSNLSFVEKVTQRVDINHIVEELQSEIEAFDTNTTVEPNIFPNSQESLEFERIIQKVETKINNAIKHSPSNLFKAMTIVQIYLFIVMLAIHQALGSNPRRIN